MYEICLKPVNVSSYLLIVIVFNISSVVHEHRLSRNEKVIKPTIFFVQIVSDTVF
jgi:hypothetical protein